MPRAQPSFVAPHEEEFRSKCLYTAILNKQEKLQLRREARLRLITWKHSTGPTQAEAGIPALPA